MSKPIIAVGVLHKNKIGRYEAREEAPDGNATEWEYSSGRGIEFLYRFFDEDENFNPVERTSWRASRVEHNGEDYYIVGYPDTQLEGLTVRLRKAW